MWQTWLKLRKGPPTWLSIMSSSFIQLLFYFLMWCIGYITCLIITKNCKETEIYKVAIKNLQSTQWLKISEKVSFYNITFISNFILFWIFLPKIDFTHFRWFSNSVQTIRLPNQFLVWRNFWCAFALSTMPTFIVWESFSGKEGQSCKRTVMFC